MINLELTEEEAENLYTLLGLHSLDSSVDTYPIFEKLDKYVAERPGDQWIYDLNRTGINTQGLIYIS